MTTLLTGPILSQKNKKAKSAVIFLHGYGANGDDLIEIGKEWSKSLPDTVFLSPNAPFKCSFSDNSYQWFELTSIAPEKIIDGLNKAGPFLNNYINFVAKEYQIKNDKIIFTTFSQGTMMALYHLCKRKEKCAGIMGFSGLLCENQNFDMEVKSKFPIRLYHGFNDEVILSEYCVKAFDKFKSLGFDIDYKIKKDLGHGIDIEGLIYGKDFIEKILII